MIVNDYTDGLLKAAEYVKERFGLCHAALTLGSGLSNFVVDVLDASCPRIKYQDIPGMPAVGVSGHRGELVLGTFDGYKVLCFAGRFHAYESYPTHLTTWLPRLAAACGCKLYFATNAAGGADLNFEGADLMIIKDHYNGTGMSPVFQTIAEPGFSNGQEFTDARDIYSERLATLSEELFPKIFAEREEAIKAYRLKKAEEAETEEEAIRQREANDKLQEKLHRGCYCWSPGPSFETKNEVHRGVSMNAIAFGMSTVPETIAAHALGMEVFAISVICNLAAGYSKHQLTHEEVKEAAELASFTLQPLVREIFAHLGRNDPLEHHELTFEHPEMKIPLVPTREQCPTIDVIDADIAVIRETIGELEIDGAFFCECKHKAGSAIKEILYKVPVTTLKGFPWKSKFANTTNLVFAELNDPEHSDVERTRVIMAIPISISSVFDADESRYIATLLLRMGISWAMQSVIAVSNSDNELTRTPFIVKDTLFMTKNIPCPMLPPYYESHTVLPGLRTNLASTGSSAFPTINLAVEAPSTIPSVGTLRGYLGVTSSIISPEEKFMKCEATTIADLGILTSLRSHGIPTAIIGATLCGVAEPMDVSSAEVFGASIANMLVESRLDLDNFGPDYVEAPVVRERVYTPYTEQINGSSYSEAVEDADVLKNLLEWDYQGSKAVAFIIDGADGGVSIPFHPSGSIRVEMREETPVVIVTGEFNCTHGAPLEGTTKLLRALALMGVHHFVSVHQGYVREGVIDTSKPIILNELVNQWGDSSLWGHNCVEIGTRFPDATKLYDAETNQKIAERLGFEQVPATVTLGPITGPMLDFAHDIGCKVLLTGVGLEGVCLTQMGTLEDAKIKPCKLTSLVHLHPVTITEECLELEPYLAEMSDEIMSGILDIIC
ncbi:hypothetical protein PCE1_000011 [Barthelona sp. PCE]